VLGLLSYACGQVSSNWRRADLTASSRTVWLPWIAGRRRPRERRLL